MVELEHVYKRYGSFFAVSDVSFKVANGQVVGFLGPNGAGKSTTMKMIAGLVSPTSGSIRVAEKDVFNDTMACKSTLGFLPEIPPVYKEMLVQDYLKFVAEIRDIGKKSIKGRVNHVLEQCQLEHVRKRLIGNLSKGYQQRVGIAQAIIHDPSVIILDEPTIGLDPAQILEIRALIKSFSQVRTVIISTHILQEVTAMCDRVIVINNGRIVADQTLTEGVNIENFYLDVVMGDQRPSLQ
jgi:ABC-2 type transport system ATP-binding protein